MVLGGKGTTVVFWVFGDEVTFGHNSEWSSARRLKGKVM